MAGSKSSSKRTATGFRSSLGQRFNSFSTSQVMTPIVVVVLLFGGLIATLTYVFRELKEKGLFFPENSLPIMLIMGTLSLLLAVSAVVVVFARLDLTSYKHPLGLPEGSIRAVIALLLIVLFFITAVFLYSDVSRPQASRTLEGIDAARLALIPTEQIQDLDQTDTSPPQYTVSLRTEKNAESKDIAKQLVTTVSTLVVAIAAFYFGSNSVQSAVNATRRTSEPDPDDEEDEPDAPPPPAPGGPAVVDPAEDSTDLVAATTADNAEVPDTSKNVPQHHRPVRGAPT